MIDAEELKGHESNFDAKMAEADSVGDAEAVRREHLGKKGPINEVMGHMRSLSK